MVENIDLGSGALGQAPALMFMSVTYLTFHSLGFLICKMGLITVSTS